MASKGQGIREGQRAPNDILSRIIGVVKGLAEAVMAQAESNRVVLQCMHETQDRNNNHYSEGSGNSVGEAFIANPCYQGLSEFRKATPPSFHGDYNPVLAEKWVMQLGKIFTVMGCANSQKVIFATYMLEGEVEHCKRGAKVY